MSDWHVYIVRCADDTLYTGVTTDVQRRITEHNSSDLGAKYTRSRRPVKLVYCEECADRSAACQREVALKKLSKQAKENLVGVENKN